MTPGRSSRRTLHIENTVHEFAAWKQVFDKFERLRVDAGVRHVRISRRGGEPVVVLVDLDFDSVAEAIAFRGTLEKIWATPQSRQQLANHASADLHELVEHRPIRTASAGVV